MSVSDWSEIKFRPVQQMVDRVENAKTESESAYFHELLYLGEFLLKLATIELVAFVEEGIDGHRYDLERRIVGADSVGTWAGIIDDALQGPASQHLSDSGRESQRALTTSQPPAADTWQRRAIDHLNLTLRQFDQDAEDVSRKRSSMRQWLRDFAALRNRTRGHGTPLPSRMGEAADHLDRSLRDVVTHIPFMNRSWAHLRRGLSGKYRVSEIGGNREDFSKFSRETTHAITDGIYVHTGSSPVRVPLLLTDRDAVDYYLPNGNFRNGKFESHCYYKDESRTEDGTRWIAPAEARPGSETRSRPELDIVGQAFTNMPSRPQHFVARRNLENELRELLSDDRHPVITLQGRGGIGKTSLALQVLHDVAESGGAFAIVWFSARDIDLLPEGPKTVREDVLTIADVAHDFFRLLGDGTDVKPAAQREFLTARLSDGNPEERYIFVFDNFETLREPMELYAYVSNAVRLPNKVLITTRTRDFKADFPIEVRGMEREEHCELVDDVASRLGITEPVTTDLQDRLYEESGGHPYITKILIGEMLGNGHLVPLNRAANRDAMLDALFERSYSALSPAAQRAFLTLCGWRSLVPRVGLEAALMRSDSEPIDIESALDELEKFSLVDRYADSDNTAYLAVPLAASIFGKRKVVTSPYKSLIDADLELVRGFGAMSSTDVGQGIDKRVQRMVRAIAKRAEGGEEIRSGLDVLAYIAGQYPRAWLYLADLQGEQGLTESVGDSIRRYVESVPSDPEGWRRLVSHLRATGDTRGEINARVQMAQVPTVGFGDVSTAAARLNSMLSAGKLTIDSDEKKGLAASIRAVLEARINEADSTDLSRLAWLCMHLQDPQAARQFVDLGLERDPANEHCVRLNARLLS
jgi:hypothetical protein